MTPKKESLAERAARGEYDLVLPLDQKILEELPPDGTMLAGLYELGSTASDVQKKYPALTTGTISTRLRILREQGLVKIVRLVAGGKRGGRNAWQRTELAEKWLRENGGGHANG